MTNATNAATPNTADDKATLLKALLAETGFATKPVSPAQAKAGVTPNSVPGITAGMAGQQAEAPTWQYATSSLIAGRSYRTNSAGLHNALKALALLGAPGSFKAMRDAVNNAGGRVTEDAMWCGSRDLVDLGLAKAVQVGQKKLVAITEQGANHLLAVIAASEQAGQPVWVCTFDGTITACDRANTVLQAPTPAAEAPSEEVTAEAPAEEAAAKPRKARK